MKFLSVTLLFLRNVIGNLVWPVGGVLTAIVGGSVLSSYIGYVTLGVIADIPDYPSTWSGMLLEEHLFCWLLTLMALGTIGVIFYLVFWEWLGSQWKNARSQIEWEHRKEVQGVVVKSMDDEIGDLLTKISQTEDRLKEGVG